MAILVLGLILFIGVHSVRIVAAPWRAAQIARFGKAGWRAAFAVLSLLGIALIAYGYGLARREPVLVWAPPFWMAHVTALLTAVAFIFIAAAFVPGNHFKQILGHPFLCGVALWAFAHLLTNGTLNAIFLFGAFLVWASLDMCSERRRDREAGVVYPQGTVARDAGVVAIGLVAWAVFAFWLHGLLIGVRPLA
ncbi:NnrU family protein [Paraburkholderia ferrariae]|uniref:NnrU family protein n=1 Tax=Paraburkholderia ferrariae TaxID=386056 RepID=UPI00047FF336|nr:NnrU family protein [Paraburkholderia ferrariae]